MPYAIGVSDGTRQPTLVNGCGCAHESDLGLLIGDSGTPSIGVKKLCCQWTEYDTNDNSRHFASNMQMSACVVYKRVWQFPANCSKGSLTSFSEVEFLLYFHRNYAVHNDECAWVSRSARLRDL